MRLILSNDISKFIPLTAELTKISKAERTQTAIKKFFIFLLLAIVSIFVPVGHFVLVPLFLILSFVAPYKAYHRDIRLRLHKPVGCIECLKPLKDEYILDEVLRVKCHHCSANYLVEQ